MTKDLVTINGMGVPTTTSLKVAEVFGKQHKDVLKKIQALEFSMGFKKRNFKLVEYTDLKGEKRPMYEMTRDGWTFLVTCFTRMKATHFLLKYVEAFNKMEAALKAKFDVSRLSRREILQMALDEEEERLKLEPKVIEMEPKVKN